MRRSLFILAAALAALPAAAAPPPAPVASGEGIALGPGLRPVEVQDSRLPAC